MPSQFSHYKSHLQILLGILLLPSDQSRTTQLSKRLEHPLYAKDTRCSLSGWSARWPIFSTTDNRLNSMSLSYKTQGLLWQLLLCLSHRFFGLPLHRCWRRSMALCICIICWVTFYPASFKDEADHCLLTDFGMVQSQITVDNVEFVFRHLVSVL